MPGMIYWSAEMVDQLHAMSDSGLTSKEIAKRMHLPVMSIVCKLRYRHTTSGSVSLDAILPMLDEGVGPSEIARRLGVTKGAVMGKIGRAGLCKIHYSGSTTMDRLAALHDRMDRILEENASAKFRYD